MKTPIENNESSSPYHGMDNKDILENNKYIAKLFYDVFSTSVGIEIMQYLKSKTVDLPCFFPGQSPDYGYFREGQNNFYRYIDKLINLGKDI